MKTFEIMLKIEIFAPELSMDEIDERLFEAGFDDALISHCGSGKIAISLNRDAQSMESLAASVLHQLYGVFPKAKLLFHN